jgi:nitrogen fixation protein NifU and related proteins
MDFNLYKEELMDHYRHPRNYGTLDNPHITGQMVNSACGDSVSFQAYIQDNNIAELKFQASGCVISQATASLLTERCKGHTLAAIKNMTKDDITALVGIALGPTRLRCALLPLEALQTGITNYNSNYQA